MRQEDRLKQMIGNEDYWYLKIKREAKWLGPFKIATLLDKCFNEEYKPPDSNSIYLISREAWERSPYNCTPLYIGSLTGNTPRLRDRIGDLIADMFGFFFHHSGGQSIYYYCKEENLNPKELYIGWLEKCGCMRCAENYYYNLLEPKLNINKPSKCREHNDPYSGVIP